MSVFRFARNDVPTESQNERYMIGAITVEHFGPGDEIVLVEYPEAYYLRDNRDGTRILYTGFKDKKKAVREAMRRMHQYHQNNHQPQASV
jgi:hypothetical protein